MQSVNDAEVQMMNGRELVSLQAVEDGIYQAGEITVMAGSQGMAWSETDNVNMMIYRVQVYRENHCVHKCLIYKTNKLYNNVNCSDPYPYKTYRGGVCGCTKQCCLWI